MPIRHKTFLLANAVSALAVSAIVGAAMAADLKLRPQVRSADTSDYNQTPPVAKPGILAEKKTAPNTRDVTGTIASPGKARASLTPPDTSDYNQTPPVAKPTIVTEKKTGPNPRDVTGTIEWPASARASLTPATAAISHTYSARASFAKARAAMESGILLREDVPKPNFASLEAATGDVLSELKALDLVTQHRSDEAIKRAMTLVQDWYETGLKIIKPPEQGITALPFPSTVATKANAVSTALDQLIERANAAATPNRSEQRSDVQIRSPGSISAAPSRVPPSRQ